MKRRKKDYRQVRNLSLPSWLKLRMNDDLKTQAEWMIGKATGVNADSMSITALYQHRPWAVILTVKRRHNNNGHQKR